VKPVLMLLRIIPRLRSSPMIAFLFGSVGIQRHRTFSGYRINVQPSYGSKDTGTVPRIGFVPRAIVSRKHPRRRSRGYVPHLWQRSWSILGRRLRLGHWQGLRCGSPASAPNRWRP
jgi:hypothetical protein